MNECPDVEDGIAIHVVSANAIYNYIREQDENPTQCNKW